MAAERKTSQKSIYADADVWARFTKFRAQFPKVSDSQFWNAALNFYLNYAERGIDANLQPYTLENGPKLVPMPSYDDLRKAVADYMKHSKQPRNS